VTDVEVQMLSSGSRGLSRIAICSGAKLASLDVVEIQRVPTCLEAV
jgi:hypothetical protein